MLLNLLKINLLQMNGKSDDHKLSLNLFEFMKVSCAFLIIIIETE